ncbi:unnamed protein product, partial [Ilex paraguariensis]
MEVEENVEMVNQEGGPINDECNGICLKDLEKEDLLSQRIDEAREYDLEMVNERISVRGVADEGIDGMKDYDGMNPLLHSIADGSDE